MIPRSPGGSEPYGITPQASYLPLSKNDPSSLKLELLLTFHHPVTRPLHSLCPFIADLKDI